jgi:hypothetical protein
MNIKLILASVAILGSATTALASAECLPAPAQVTLQAPAPAFQNDIYRPWVVLSAGDKIGRSGREQIELGRTRPLHKIELQATSGRTDVREVAIKFANGQSEVVKENAVLERGGASLCIDLAGYRGRDVTAIRVFGGSSPRGSFKVLGTVSSNAS